MPEKIQELRAEFTADMMNLNKGIGKAQRSMTQLGQQVGRIGKSFTQFGKRTAIVGGVLSIAMGAIVTSLVKVSSEAEETQAKFEAVFEDITAEATKWANNFSESFGAATIDVKGWLAAVQDTLVPIGIAKDESWELSKQIVTLSADLASFHNAAGGAQEVMGLLLSALVGNHEAVRRFGIIITEAMLKEHALTEGLWDGTGAMEMQNKVLARLSLIMKGAGKAVGDLARTQSSFANQVRRTAGTLKDLRVKLGDILKKNVRPYLLSINKTITATQKWLNVNEKWLGLKIGAAFDNMAIGLSKIGEFLKPVVEWSQRHSELLGDIIPQMILLGPLLLVAGGGAFALAGKLMSLAASFIIVLGGIGGALAMLNPWAIAILAVVAGLAILITKTDFFTQMMTRFKMALDRGLSPLEAINLMFNILGDGIKNFLSDVWRKLMGALGPQGAKTLEGLADTFKKLGKVIISESKKFIGFLLIQFDELFDWVKENWPEIKIIITDTINAIRWGIENILIPVIKIVMTMLKTNIQVATTLIKLFGELVLGVFRVIKSGIFRNWSGMWKDMMTDMSRWINKIKDKITEWKVWIVDIFGSIREWIVGTFNLAERHSPSVLDVMGQSFDQMRGMIAQFGSEMAGMNLAPAVSGALSGAAAGGAMTDNRRVDMNVTTDMDLELIKRAIGDAMGIDSFARRSL